MHHVGFLQCIFKDCTKRISCYSPSELGIGRRKVTLLVEDKCCHPWVFPLSPVLLCAPLSDGTLDLGFLQRPGLPSALPGSIFAASLPSAHHRACSSAPLGDGVSRHLGFVVHLLEMPLNPFCSFHQAISPMPRYFPTRRNTLVLPRMDIKSGRTLRALFSTDAQGIAFFSPSSPWVSVLLLHVLSDAPTPPFRPL